jgi:hypothetical protein
MVTKQLHIISAFIYIFLANFLPYLRQRVYIIGTCIIHQYFLGTVVVVIVWLLS